MAPREVKEMEGHTKGAKDEEDYLLSVSKSKEEEGEVESMTKLTYSFPLEDYGFIEESDDGVVPLYTATITRTGLNSMVSEYVDPNKVTNAMKRYFSEDG